MIVKDLIPGMGVKAFAIMNMESHENAGSPSALGGNRQFQGPEASRLIVSIQIPMQRAG